MRSGDREFPFSPNFNFGTDNLYNSKSYENTGSITPVTGNFKLLDGTDFNLLDNTKLLLL